MPDGMLSSQQARNQEKKRDLAEEYLVSFFESKRGRASPPKFHS
jgi:hypothetical protein